MPAEWQNAASVFGVLAWLVTIVVAVLRGREMVAKMALAAIGSLEGRAVVLAITSDKHGRIEEKLDTLVRTLDGMALRLEGRIDQMTAKIETQLTRLDADTREMEVRLAVLEQRGIGREER